MRPGTQVVLAAAAMAVLPGRVCMSAPAPESATTMTISLPSATPWARVLERFEVQGGLDYAGLRAAPEDLDDYLASLAGAQPAGAGREERIAFWVNAYNAVTTRFVLDLYPGVESVKDIDGFFDSLRMPVAGESLTLDEIETRARAEGEPRVHFAIVCASTSCPDLRFEPYRGGDLERQLEEQTQTFLADPTKGLRLDGEELWVSSIFKWYAGDFTGGSTVLAFFARTKVLEWVVAHVPGDLADRVRAAAPAVRYLDYDWSLNDKKRGQVRPP